MALSEKKTVLSVIILAGLITFLRWPEILSDAQFWAEDGMFWWPEARAKGLASLWLPHTGYFQTDDRLVALLAVFFPLAWGPALFACAALFFEVLPPAFLVSSRCAVICPSLLLRSCLALAWCALPNTWEVHGNLTNSQWHLGLLSFLIVMSSPPQTRRSWIFDIFFLGVSAVSGPFSILLTPVAALRAWWLPSKASITRVIILGAGALIQAVCIYMSQRGVPPLLGATPMNFVRLMSGQIILATIVGCHHLPHWYGLAIWRYMVLPCLLFIAAAWLCLNAAYRWSSFRYALFFTVLILGACLSHPLPLSHGEQVWVRMRMPDTGMRYLFLPLVFWVSVVVAQALAAPRGWTRNLAIVFLVLIMCVGVPRDWRFMPEADRQFYDIAHYFDHAPPGTRVTIPVRPGAEAVLIR